MKKNLYPLFISVSCILLFLNNSGGRADSAGVGNTGAPGDSPDVCQSCHSSGAFGPPSMKVELYDSANTTKLTVYRPGLQHVVRVTTTATGVPANGGYGFQMIDIRKITGTPVNGILPTAQQNIGTNVKAITLASAARTYAEHRLGKSPTNVFNVRWRAPAVGQGAIEFFAAGNAVNGNSSESGDGAATAKLEVAEAPISSIDDVNEKIRFELSPNPVVDQVTLNVNSALDRRLKIHILNITGQSVLSEKWEIGTGDNVRTLNLRNLNRGVYMIQVIENQVVVTKKVFKL